MNQNFKLWELVTNGLNKKNHKKLGHVLSTVSTKLLNIFDIFKINVKTSLSRKRGRMDERINPRSHRVATL